MTTADTTTATPTTTTGTTTADAPGTVTGPGTGATAGSGGRTTVRTLRVRSREQAADDVVALRLESPDGGPLPDWSPGAHVDLLLRDGLVRQYSLCGDPADRRAWRLGVRRAPDGGRGGSRAVFEDLLPGSEVQVRGPRNAFALRTSPRYLFLAGGIGITPILPMLARAEADGADWQLVYGGRTRATMPFLPELARYGRRVRVLPEDESGLLPVGALLKDLPERTLVYCCGPQPLLDAVTAALRHRPDDLVAERFAPAPSPGPAASAGALLSPARAASPATAARSGPDAAAVADRTMAADPDDDGPAADAGRPAAFEVELAVSGRVLTVPPDRSVLQTLEEAGVPVLSSCREGVCGTCEVDVLAGRVEHRDRLLTEEERAADATMMVCVSRSRGPRLVLGL